jgi:hypothetical protein
MPHAIQLSNIDFRADIVSFTGRLIRVDWGNKSKVCAQGLRCVGLADASAAMNPV